MNNTPLTVPPASFAKISFAARPKIFGGLITLLLLIVSLARAETPDEKYLNIVSTIDQADSLSANGQTVLAHTKYLQAQAALMAFKRDNPLSDPRAVTYRLNYLADKVAASPKSTATSGASSEKKTTASSAANQLKLLSPGAEPRQLLRLHPSAGDKQSLVMTTKTAMTMTMGDTPTPAMKLPATQMSMDLTVKNVAASGDITYEMLVGDASVVSDPDVMPMVADTMNATVSKFKGMAGTGTLSDRGFSLGMEMKLPAEVDAQTRQTLDQMKESLGGSGAPFPEEAVGPGARWEVKSKIKTQGMTIDQTMTYELVTSEDGHLSLKTAIEQTAANQKIESPTMPGLKVDLTKLTGKGTGSTSLDLAKLMPTESNMDEHTEMAMSVNMAGQKQSMTTKLDASVHVGAN